MKFLWLALAKKLDNLDVRVVCSFSSRSFILLKSAFERMTGISQSLFSETSPATAVLSWLDCSTTCFQTSNRTAVTENKTQK